MSTIIVDIPEIIQKHIKEVIKTSSMEDTAESFEKLTNGWIEKKETFEEKMIELGMEETGCMEKDDERAALALTYSGSLITIGPLEGGTRKIDYTSIGFRKDVPEALSREDCELATDIEIDQPILFENGPIKQTSPIYKIVVCTESLSPAEQTQIIEEATTLIVDNFVQTNNEIMN